MWYDKMVIKTLLLIAKILSRKSENCFGFEIENLVREMEGENK